ncbi:MAG: glycosyltransferase family 4 protein [Lachnospiraceae bacterium]|nr:glycosyltransferase family 4 protein [Lachnospiraceae bacterium]
MTTVIKKKVLMIGPARSVKGGVSAVVNDYYRAGLDKQIELAYIGTMEDGSKWHKLLVAVKALLTFLVSVNKFDIVHIHMASDSSIYRKMPFIWIACWKHKKIIIHQHGGNFREFYFEHCGSFRQKLIRKTLNRGDKLLVIAPYLREIFAQLVEESKLVFFPNAIPVPSGIEKSYDGQDILFLGRMCKEKGIEELLDACRVLQKEFPKLQLYLGGIWEDEGLKKKADALGSRVHQLGWINTEEKEQYLRTCNIFVLPSYFEGHPMSLLEGMAFQCACVGTDIGGISQMITDEENGLLIPVKDEKALEEALRRLLSDRSLQEKLGRAAGRKIEQEYNLEKNLLKLLEVYRFGDEDA